ncbi:MAG: PAS domain S-box protein [Armatimonadia bacterium]
MSQANPGSIEPINLDEIAPLLRLLHDAVRIPVRLLTPEGTLRLGVGAEDLCRECHQGHAETQAAALVESGGYALQRCPSGLHQALFPLRILGQHTATLSLGRFLYEDDPLDEDLFRAEADRCGVAPETYQEALRNVPSLSREDVQQALMHAAWLVAAVADQGERVQGLHRDRAFLQKVFEVTPAFISVTDREGRLLMASRALGRALGHETEAMVGRTRQELYGDQEEGRALAADASEVLRSGRPVTHEAERVTFADGSAHWLRSVRVPLTDETGQRTQVLSLGTDITELREAQQAVAASEQQLRRILEGSSDGYWEWHVQSGAAAISEKSLRMLGYEPGDVLPTQEGWLTLIHPDDLATLREMVGACLRGETVNLVSEHRVRAKDGTWRWVQARGAVCEWDEEGRPVLLSGVHTDVSARRAAEEELALARYSLEHATDLVFWATSDGRFAFVNDACCRNLEYTKEEFGSLVVWDIAPRNSLHHWPNTWQQICSEGTITVESVLQAKSGRQFPVEVTCNYLHYGENEYVCSYARDISRRRAQQRRQEEIATGLRAVLRSADELLRCADTESLCRLAVEGSCRNLGLEQSILYLREGDQLLGAYRASRPEAQAIRHEETLPLSGCAELIEPDAPQWCPRQTEEGPWSVWTQVCAGEDLVGVLCNTGGADGSGIDSLKQDILAVYCSLLGNVLARKAADDKLRESEEEYRILVDAAPYAVFVVCDGRYLFSNRTGAALLGCERPEEVVGRPVLEPASTEDTLRLQAAADMISLGEEPATVEVEVKAPGGEPRYLEITLVPTRREGQSATLWVCRDTTVRRHAEDAQRLAAVGQLAAGVAHEFNNLLASLLLRAERADMVQTPEEYDKLVALVLKATGRGADICRSLTAFARPHEPRRESITIEAAIEAALRIASRQLANAGISVRRDYGTGGVTISADQGQLEQVFLNLVINACHAMPRGGILTVETRHLPAAVGPGEVTATVSDTGTGIASEHLPRLFEPFFTTKGRLGQSDVPGTGLGLSVSHGIVQAHGGSISVRSREGEGAAFTLCFDAQPWDTSAPEAAGKALAASLKAERPRLRILIAEDERELCDILSEDLMAEGYEVVTKAHTQDALHALATRPFDLVIADLMMPGGGVREILGATQRAGGRPPVIAITGRTEGHLSDDLRRLGAAGCLQKPCTLATVMEAIKEALEQGKA